LIGNIHATPLTSVQAIREELAQQIATSVQWTRSIEYLSAEGITTFIEIGPGQALTGMVKRIARDATLLNASGGPEITNVATALRKLGVIDA
jgi:[acyl-carrier-protein] S-malonyltransferase